MKKRILFALVSTCITFFHCNAETYYFDPGFVGTSLGTQSQPYNKWEDIVWGEKNVYLFKRGSTYNVSKSLKPGASNITIGAYGQGALPKIVSNEGASGRIIDLGALENVTLSDVEIQSTNMEESCVHFFKSQGGILKGCRISGSQWGVRIAMSSGRFLISDCEIFNTDDDGVFAKEADSIVIENTAVHDVNNKYRINKLETFSGGDCVQLVNVKYFQIKDNVLDHSSTGNKFCFISSSTSPNLIPTGIIENNRFVRNEMSDDGDLIYLIGSKNVIVRSNIFEYGDHAIYNHSIDLKVYKNLFRGQHTAAIYDEPKGASSTKIFNNTFIDISNGVICNAQQALVVNNILYEIKDHAFSGKGTVTTENNCFYSALRPKLLDKDVNTINEDPQFVNTNEQNYRLKDISPCKQKSSKTINKLYDYPFKDLNDKVVNSAPENMGAY